MNGFVLTNKCTDPAVTRDRLVAFAGELAAQQCEVAEWFESKPWTVMLADSEADVPQGDGWILATIQDELDDKEALAYHTETPQGRPVILMGAHIIRANAPAGTDWLCGPDSLLSATSHEFCETKGNPYVGMYFPLDGNTWIPGEICDGTQGDTYERDPGSGLWLANFCGPRYFSDGPGPYDRMGLITAPKQVRRGGYQQRLTGGPNGTSTPFFGALPHEGGMPEWKRIAKAKAGTRFAKIAARADGTDLLAQATSSTSALTSRVSDLESALRDNADTIGTYADEIQSFAAERAKLLAEIAQLRAHECANGGHGG